MIKSGLLFLVLFICNASGQTAEEKEKIQDVLEQERMLQSSDLFKDTSKVEGEDSEEPSAEEPAKSNFNISVLPIAGNEVEEAIRKIMAENFRKYLQESGKFSVMAREMMHEILQEQEFQQSDVCEETSCMVEFGKILGITQIVSINITIIKDKTYAASVKLVDVENGKMLITDSEKRTGPPFETMDRMMKNLASVIIGTPTKDHLEYLQQKEKNVKETQMVEKISGKRYMVKVMAHGNLPFRLLEPDNNAPKKAYYESADAFTEWGLPETKLEWGGTGYVGYKLGSIIWLSGKLSYHSGADKNTSALSNYNTDTSFSAGTSVVRLQGPSNYSSESVQYYNLYEMGVGFRFSLYNTPRVSLGASLIPQAGYVEYFLDSYDSSFANYNFYVDGLFLSKGQLYSQAIYQTEMTSFATGTEISIDLDIYLSETLSITTHIGWDALYAFSLEGESSVSEFTIERNGLVGEVQSDSNYTEPAAMMEGDFFNTGKHQQITNPDVKERDINGNVVSWRKATKEFSSFRTSLGLAWYF